MSSPPPIPPPLPKQSGVSAAAASLLQLRRRGPQLPPPLLLNLQELERFENLLVFARAVVEGWPLRRQTQIALSRFGGGVCGLQGEYTPGDDLARLDWRVYGRTRRLYLRQFDEETDMTAYLMLDTSGSMRYAGEKRQLEVLPRRENRRGAGLPDDVAEATRPRWCSSPKKSARNSSPPAAPGGTCTAWSRNSNASSRR